MVEPRHVLVVEPNAAVRSVIKDMLETRGYRVSGVTEGASMRDALENDGVNAVILDSSLPGETSTSLAEHAKALKLPVVVISGKHAAMTFAEEHSLQLLHKPFRIDDLCDALEEAFASGIYGRRQT